MHASQHAWDGRSLITPFTYKFKNLSHRPFVQENYKFLSALIQVRCSPQALSPQALSPQALSPQAPSPQAPSPQAPSPQAPSPQAPSPQAPSPQAPSPQAPSPQAPSPQAPSPQAPSPQALSPQAQSEFAMLVHPPQNIHSGRCQLTLANPLLEGYHHLGTVAIPCQLVWSLCVQWAVTKAGCY